MNFRLHLSVSFILFWIFVVEEAYCRPSTGSESLTPAQQPPVTSQFRSRFEHEKYWEGEGIYHRVQHGILKTVVDSEGKAVTIVEKPVKTPEYLAAQAYKDFRRHRGRMLSTTIESIDFPLGGSFLGSLGAYYIVVSLGSAKQTFTVQVDTGSDLMWVPCNCIACAQKSETYTPSPPFNPSMSSTSKFYDCSSDLCTQLSQSSAYGCNIPHGGMMNSTDTNCEYYYQYADQSSTFGNFINDVININTSTGGIAQPVVFGCGSVQAGNLVDGTGGLDGLVGFGRGGLSLITQLVDAEVIVDTFALCLEGEGQGGNLVLGRTALPANAEYIELVSTDTFYSVLLSSITVNGKALDVSEGLFSPDSNGNGGTILDSGTTFTQLPSEAFNAFLQQVMDISGIEFGTYREISNFVCSVPGGDLSDDVLDKLFPAASMVYSNGVNWEVPASHYLFHLKGGEASYACFAARDAGTGSITIIGDTWLRNNDVLYDRVNSRIGFIAMNCTTMEPLNVTGVTAGPPPPPTERQPLPSTSTVASPDSGSRVESSLLALFLGLLAAIFLL